MSRILLAALAALGVASLAESRALTLRRQPGTATAMAGLEGEACDEDEHKRYKTIVCQVEDASLGVCVHLGGGVFGQGSCGGPGGSGRAEFLVAGTADLCPGRRGRADPAE